MHAVPWATSTLGDLQVKLHAGVKLTKLLSDLTGLLSSFAPQQRS